MSESLTPKNLQEYFELVKSARDFKINIENSGLTSEAALRKNSMMLFTDNKEFLPLKSPDYLKNYIEKFSNIPDMNSAVLYWVQAEIGKNLLEADKAKRLGNVSEATRFVKRAHEIIANIQPLNAHLGLNFKKVENSPAPLKKPVKTLKNTLKQPMPDLGRSPLQTENEGIIAMLESWAGKAPKLKENTIHEYERMTAHLFDDKNIFKPGIEEEFAQLRGTSSDYVLKAAILYRMKDRVHSILNGITSFNAKNVSQTKKDIEINSFFKKFIPEFEAMKIVEKTDWWKEHCEARESQVWRKENHKKSPAKDKEIEDFWKKVGNDHKYSEAFLIMEFTGMRPEEFKDGVEMVWEVRNGKAGMTFLIKNRAKQKEFGTKGFKHGLKKSAFFVEMPSSSTPHAIRERFTKLKSLYTQNKTKNKWVYTVTGTDSSSVGDLISKSYSKVAKKAGLNISAISLRHRFASNAKASAREKFPGDPKAAAKEVAYMMGQASTQTQLKYGRTNRRKGGVSFIKTENITNPPHEIRCTRANGGHPAVQKVKIGSTANTQFYVRPNIPRPGEK